MNRWMKSAGKSVIGRVAEAAAPVPDGRGNAGEYQLLFKYLRDRYADRVVLTFTEIEDLLGFSLPEPARHQQEWWDATGIVARRPSQTDAWTLANRTAKVNLAAQRVVFDRLP